MVLNQLRGTSACILSCKCVNLCFIWNHSIIYGFFTNNIIQINFTSSRLVRCILKG